MKNSSSPLLRLHLCSRSGRTSGSGRGGGLKVASACFISTSSGSCFTVDVFRQNLYACTYDNNIAHRLAKLIRALIQVLESDQMHEALILLHPPSTEGSVASSRSVFSILTAALLNSSLNPHPDTAKGSWTGQLFCSLLRKGSSMN